VRDKCILPFLITERLEFFQLTQADLPELEILLGDPEIMYAWEHGFTKIESQAWLNENLRRYSSDGYSYWAVRKKNDGSLIGVMGILKEVAEGKHIF
jgi:RimJ/RimL family protein N-acetyltransferase